MYEIYVKWTPRDLAGRFAKAEIDGIDSLFFMEMVQLAGAEASAEAAPSWHGFLAGEMFVGGGGKSRFTKTIATVSPNSPYAPSQDRGFSGSVDPDGGVYYSLRTWVLEHGMDEDAVYPIARNLNYEGQEFMSEGFTAMMYAVDTGMGELLADFLFDMGFR
jgi:hypothetical protein